MALNNEFPRRTNSLLTTEEKCIIDQLPEDARQAFLAAQGDRTGRVTVMNADGVSTIELESPIRVQAVKDYIEMIDDLRNNG